MLGQSFRNVIGEQKQIQSQQREVKRQEREAAKTELERIKPLYRQALRDKDAQKIQELGSEVTRLRGISNPFAFGLLQGSTPLSATGAISESLGQDRNFLQEVEQQPGFGAGALTSNIGRQAVTYATVNSALAGSKLLGGLSKLLGGTKRAQFAATQAVDLAADAIVQTPLEAIEAIQEDKDLDQFGKEWLVNRGIDAVMNLAIGGLGTSEGRQLLKSDVTKLKDIAKNYPDLFKKSFDKLGANQKGFIIDAGIVPKVEVPLSPTLMQTVEQTPETILKSRRAVVEKPETNLSTVLKYNEDLNGIAESTPISKIAKGEPIDTKSIITTELPTRAKIPVKEKLERFYQEIFNQRQPAISAGGDVANIANLNRSTGTIEYMLANKQVDMNGNPIGNSVFEIFETVPAGKKQDLFDLAYNQHNLDRWREGKPVFGETVDDVVSQQNIDKILANNPELAETQQQIVKYFQNNLDEWAVKSGLASQETADMLKETYKNYVPTHRVKDFPRSMSNQSQNVAQILKKAKGSQEAILPLDQQMVMLTDKLVRNARRNEVMTDLYDAYKAGESGNYIEDVIDLPKQKVNDILDLGDFETPSVIKDKYVLNFYDNGNPKQMIVNKPLFEAFSTINNESFLNSIANGINKYGTKNLKELVTGKNPFFALSNIMRDVPTALTFSDNAISLVKNTPKAVKQMLQNGELYQQFKALGNAREGLIGSGKNVKVPSLGSKSQLERVARQVGKKNPITLVGQFNEFTEQLPRFAEFISVLEKTGNPALASYKAAELTTDFARFGKTTKSIDRVVPYLNPSVQGIDRFGRAIINNPIKTSAQAGAVISVPTLILDQINKDNEAYNSLTPRERNFYYQIPYTDEDGNQKFIRIPKSRELGVAFSSVFEWASRAARGQKVTGEEIKQAIEENFKPASITDQFIFTPALKAWEQIKDPDAYQTNFWGGLIVPQSQRRYSPGEQYDANTSGIAKAIGQQLEISPFVIDYLIDSYTGVLGQTIQPIGQESTPDTSPLSLLTEPFKKKFTTDPVFRSNAVAEFYDLLDENKKAAQDYNRANDIPSEEITPLEEKANAQQKVARQISALNKELKELQKQKTSDERLRKLQEEINKIAREAIRRYE